MRTISNLLALLCLVPLTRTLAGPLDFWTRTLASTNSYVQQGCGIYANGRWVISMGAASGGTNMTLMSEDAATWRMVREQVITRLTSGNGLIVGFAPSTGTILSSPDGVRWISKIFPIPTGSTPQLMFGLGRFWAHVEGFPAPGEHVMLHSSDALEWTIAWTNKWKLVSQVADGVSRVRLPAYCHDRFLTVVDGPAQDWAPGVEVLESSDGIDFRPSPTWPMLRNIAHLSGTWVGVLTTNPGMVAVSMDGAAWTNIAPHFRFSDSGVLKTIGERFLAGANANYFWSSKDGLNWTDHEVDLGFTTAWEGLRVQDLVPGSDRVLAVANLRLRSNTNRVTDVVRLYLSQPLTNAVAPVLGIGRQPALRLESGSVGSGYHIEAADAPNMPWRRLATVYPQAFPFTFLAPEPDQPHQIYRAVARD